MKNSILKRRLARYTTVMGAAVLLGVVSTGCKDDLLTGQPSWLGQSIYDELEQRGNYTQTLALINAQSADYATVLKKTGSKTLFVANDDAWAQFYQNNPWGVHSIAEMTDAQKKLLFKSNMINSAYLVELMGNIPTTGEPKEGYCMRRETSVDITDSIPLVTRDKYPVINPQRVDSLDRQIDYWSRVRGRESIRLLEDNEVSPMIHMMPRFMKTNNISSSDISWMTDGAVSGNNEAYVNGKKIVEQDVTCQNGYIQVMSGVPMQLDNMANIISQKPQFSIYNRLLDRFSYPHYDRSTSELYKESFGVDSIFIKRYFNSWTGDAGKFTTTDDGDPVNTQLPYDPGWNRYTLYSSDGSTTYQYDAAAMLVPTDSAMKAYLEVDGKDLNQRYAKAGPGATAWDNAPDKVILPLLKNTMLSSIKSAVPSQFGSINNTAGEKMNVHEEDIEGKYWACNGIIYQTKKVYVAPEYISVFYPCIVRGDEDLNLVYTVVDNDNKLAGGEGFYAYLNNMGSKYSFIIPTDNALQTYYDPVSYKRTDSKKESTSVAYKFFISTAGNIAANAFDIDWNDVDLQKRPKIGDQNKKISISTSADNTSDAFNHFKDILNSSLSVSEFTPSQNFYEAKNGGPIVVRWDGNTVTGVAGSFQYERGYFVDVTEVVDKSEGNGKSYIINQEPLMSTMTSPYAALTCDSNYDYFHEFAKLMLDAELFSADDGNSHATMDSCLTDLNNYHYTIYVPTNTSIKQLVDDHKLPTGDIMDEIQTCLDQCELDSADEAFLTEQKAIMKQKLVDFVKYHIQDNSIYVGGKSITDGKYESACLDTATTRFVKLTVNNVSGNGITITDNCNNTRTVDRNKCNVLTRQYYFNGANLQGTSCSQIYSSSFAVLHQIDEPLYPSKTCLYDPDDYSRVEAILAAHPIGTEARAHKTLKRYKR